MGGIFRQIQVLSLNLSLCFSHRANEVNESNETKQLPSFRAASRGDGTYSQCMYQGSCFLQIVYFLITVRYSLVTYKSLKMKQLKYLHIYMERKTNDELSKDFRLILSSDKLVSAQANDVSSRLLTPGSSLAVTSYSADL